jgi:hypothetical protein
MTAAGASESTNGVVRDLRDLVRAGVLELPPPAAGETPRRLLQLAAIAASDLQLGRLAEAHLDAVTILGESGRTASGDCLYGVWASEAPQATLQLAPSNDHFVLEGSKAFCTGFGLVDRALVTARMNEATILVEIPIVHAQLSGRCEAWVAPAFAKIGNATIEVKSMRVERDQIIGGPNWYLERVGFWHGALAPAACWAGGALGLIAHCLRLAKNPDEHTLAHLGILDANAWELRSVLATAGAALDELPDDAQHAVLTAYRMRACVERLVTATIDHAARAYGPRLLAFDPWASGRVAELQLYVRQHQDARDHAELGRRAIAAVVPANPRVNRSIGGDSAYADAASEEGGG